MVRDPSDSTAGPATIDRFQCTVGTATDKLCADPWILNCGGRALTTDSSRFLPRGNCEAKAPPPVSWLGAS